MDIVKILAMDRKEFQNKKNSNKADRKKQPCKNKDVLLRVNLSPPFS